MFYILKSIAEAKGNKKIEIMKAHPEIKEVLKRTYDPFQKYYLTAPPDLMGTIGGEYFFDSAFALLDDLSNRVITGQSAFEAVCDQIVSLTPENAIIFKMIINKDLRAGISIKTINKAFPGLIPLTFNGAEKPPVMLLKTAKLKKIKYPCMAAVKKDGVRGLFNETMISRQGHSLIGHNHIENELIGYGEGLDGELCVPGEIFDVASGLIRNDKMTPNSVYYIFDAPTVPGTKLERYKWLLKNITPTYHINIIYHFIINSEQELFRFYKKTLLKGEEGIVIYDPNSLYEDKRSYDWMRLVPLKSADCPVIGFYEGKGKHAGSLGGIIVDYKGHKVKVGTGFKERFWYQLSRTQQIKEGDDGLLYNRKTRSYIWDHQKFFLDRIAKVEYKEKTKSGSLRQPRFKTWRFDK